MAVLKKLVALLAPLMLSASIFGPIDKRIWQRMIRDVKLPYYRVYTPDPSLRALLKKIPGITVVRDCTRATLAIETKSAKIPPAECRDVPLLSNGYRLFLEDRRVIGAFFWLKSRPTIVFSRPRCERMHLKLDQEMQEYMEEIR